MTATAAAARGPIRATRAAVLGAAVLLLSLAGHVAAGGTTPGPVALALLVVPVGCLTLRLTARRLGPLTLFATLAGGQAALHETFMWLGSGPTCAGRLSNAGHGHHLTTRSLRPVGAGHCAMPMAASSHNAAMLIAHLLAAAACAALLAWGERIAFAACSWFLGRVPSAARLHVAATLRTLAPGSAAGRATIAQLLGGTGRRGPPRFAF